MISLVENVVKQQKEALLKTVESYFLKTEDEMLQWDILSNTLAHILGASLIRK